MKTIHLIISILIFGSTFAQKQIGLVYFKTSEFKLNQLQQKQLDSLILKLNKKQNILIIGHTDSVGTVEANRELSLKRSNSVKTYFVSKGISEKIIDTEYYGPFKPIASNNNESTRKLNRRTEIIQYNPAEIEKIKQRSNIQLYKFKDNKSDIWITAKGGTKIHIPAKTLVDKNKKTPHSEIRIEIQEILKKSDLILNNAHTISHEGIMETGGMIKIKAYDNSGELFMKKDSLFYISIPTENKVDGMELYTLPNDTSKEWNKLYKFNQQMDKMDYWKFLILSQLNARGIDTAKLTMLNYKKYERMFIDSLNKPFKQRNDSINAIYKKQRDSLEWISKYYFIMANDFTFYNIDKIISELYNKYGKEQAFDSVLVSNTVEDTLLYMVVLNKNKAKYFQMFSTDEQMKIPFVKDYKSTLVVKKTDPLDKIVYYDIIDLENKPITINLKMTTKEEFRKLIKKFDK